MTTQDMNNRRGRFSLAMVALAGLTTGLASTPAHANPNEGDATIAAGTAIFDSNGNLLTITTSDMTIIDWLSFNIGIGETVHFIMPDSTSRVLNRIDGATPSEINGTLMSNGQVFLVNPSGIVFGENAVVNAGALYAAAGSISNADFISRTYRFTDLQGSVVNRGFLQGNLIAMVGGEVANMGTISAPEGVVLMAAGEQVLIGTHLGSRFVEVEIPLSNPDASLADESLRLAAGDIYSLAAWNTGSITADRVYIKAGSADVGISGTINATGSDNKGFLVAQGRNVIVGDLGLNTTPVEARGGGITAGQIVMNAAPSGHIDLGQNLTSTGAGIFLNGDVRLTQSVSLISTGAFSHTQFNGDLYSESGEYNTLDIFASNGELLFGGAIGVDPTSDQRLGFLDVDTRLTSYAGNVSTRDGMTLMGYSRITGPSVTFHTGTGSALFGGNIYSQIQGGSDVAFMYDGDVWAGEGQGRTPFKFMGSIGSGPALSGVPNQGAFANIYFGSDVPGASITAASFLFSNAAAEGLDLMDAASIDLSRQFYVTATEGIYAGRGQKITSMGSIQFAARGAGSTMVQLSDVNVLGDLRILSLGRAGQDIMLLGHLGGYIDGVLNEGDRTGGGYDEQAAELIASGDIYMSGNIQTDSVGAMIGANNVILANNSASGTTLGLTIINFPGGASLTNFTGTQPGTNDKAYAYDLTLGLFKRFVNPPATQAELATSFVDEDIMNLRDDPPYLAQRQVLIELNLRPEDVRDETVREGVVDGLEHYRRTPSDIDSRGDVLVMDRVSPRSIERLTSAYIGLFGERDAESNTRPGFDQVARALESGDQDQVDITMSQIGLVLDRIDLLELTPLEIERAKTALLGKIRPSSMGEAEFKSQWAKN